MGKFWGWDLIENIFWDYPNFTLSLQYTSELFRIHNLLSFSPMAVPKQFFFCSIAALQSVFEVCTLYICSSNLRNFVLPLKKVMLFQLYLFSANLATPLINETRILLPSSFCSLTSLLGCPRLWVADHEKLLRFISRNKVLQKLKFSKNKNNKSVLLKMIFFNVEKKLERFR